jgi:hypothetical protein
MVSGGLGRYTQADPIGLRGGVNPFAYGDQNAIRHSDPLGLAVGWSTTKPRPDLNTIVCDGQGNVTIQVPDYGTQNQKECYGECIEKHELSHAADAVAKSPNVCRDRRGRPRQPGLVVWAPESLVYPSEYRAHGVLLDCLHQRRVAATANCDARCEALIDAAIDYTRSCASHTRRRGGKRAIDTAYGLAFGVSVA